MYNIYRTNTDELDINFINALKTQFAHQEIEIVVCEVSQTEEDETAYLSSSETNKKHLLYQENTMTIEKKMVSVFIEMPLFKVIENIAQNEKIPVQEILEKALYNFVKENDSIPVRKDVMKHLNASISKNHRLGELLAK